MFGSNVFPKSSFHEVKATSGLLHLSSGSSEFQILGLIDAASRSTAAGKLDRALLTFYTTADTFISAEVVAYTNKAGVTLKQSFAYEHNNGSISFSAPITLTSPRLKPAGAGRVRGTMSLPVHPTFGKSSVELKVIYEFLEEAVLFKSKEFYIEFMSEDDNFSMHEDIDLEYIVSEMDSLISELSNILGMSLDLVDTIDDLKKIDSLIEEKGISNFDFINDFDCYFTYFSKTIFNELKTDSRMITIDDEKNSLKVLKSDEEKVEIFLPLRKMVINQDENFSFFALASQIVYPYNLELHKKED